MSLAQKNKRMKNDEKYTDKNKRSFSLASNILRTAICHTRKIRPISNSSSIHTSKENKGLENVKNNDPTFRKRCLYAPCSIKLNGSYTVEAALVMPLFLFAAIAIIFFMRIVMVQWGVKTALDETAKMVSVCGGSIDDNKFTEPTALSAAAIATEKIATNGTPIKFVTLGISGFNFLESEVNKTDVNLVVHYYMKVPLSGALSKQGFLITQRSFAKRFTGFQGDEDDDELENYVYVTKYGTAYHKDLDCPYLKLSIKAVQENELGSARNNGGHKYYGCKYCGKKGFGAYYITDDGECYHTRLDCPGLKRTINRVKEEEAKKDHHACGKCVEEN